MTRPSTVRLLGTKVAKLCAALLIVLCILPNTAPFSAVGSADFATGQHADVAVATLTTHTSVSDPDDSDALVLERLHVLRQPRLCALLVIPSCDTTTVSVTYLPSFGPPAVTIDSPPLKTVLRL